MTAQQENNWNRFSVAMRAKKGHIRAFMQAHYTDERLTMLLAHARDGKLAFQSCCCFIGVTTATHALREHDINWGMKDGADHIDYSLAGAFDAEQAYLQLGHARDIERRRILIPMIRAEMKRREQLRTPTLDQQLAEVLVEA